MPRLRALRILLLLPMALLLCTAADAAPLRVVVSIQPQIWFVERLAGDLAEVTVLLAPGDSPATYEPTPRRMAVLEGADLFLAAGVPFERGLVPRIAGVPRPPLVAGPDAAAGHYSAADLDPHTWLSPAGAAALADTVAAALVRLRPDAAAAIAARRSGLEPVIAAVDERVRGILAGREGGVFVVFHPAFGHFAAAYDLVQVAIEDHGHEPGARHLVEVTTLAREQGVGAVVVQTGFSRRAAEAVAASLGVPVVELDPLARDWDTNLVHIAETLAGVLGEQGGAP